MDNVLGLIVSCQCGASTHAFQVPKSSLPLPTNLCSCDISRRISGTLLTSYINISHLPDASKPALTSLTPYKSSNILTRHFCSTCGTHMYLEYANDGHFEAATGTLQVENTDEIVDFKSCMWIEDTTDGGGSEFITLVGPKELERWMQERGHSSEVPLGWRTTPRPEKKHNSSMVYAHCHCKGVEFYISRPNEASRTAASPYPDLLIPYSLEKSNNPENEAWWLPHPNRFLAGTCACITCRRSIGFDITCWTFIPAVNIFLDAAGAQPFRRHPYWGTMKMYHSNEGVTRTFCGGCGANVFWEHNNRDTIVDVSVGLLDATSGARAEDLLAWWPGRVSFSEYALNKRLIGGLELGLKKWAERNRGKEYVATGEYPQNA